MRKSALSLAGFAFAVTVLAYAGRTATAGGQSGALIRLQLSSPGTLQSGHARISGTFIAGQFKSSGSSGTIVDLSASGTALGILSQHSATTGAVTGQATRGGHDEMCHG